MIDGDVWSGVAPLARGRRGARLGRRLLEQRERVVIGAETHEPATPRKLVRHPEPEQVRVEVVGFLEVGHVEAKVPEAANLERPIKQDAADIELRGYGDGCNHDSSLWSERTTARDRIGQAPEVAVCETMWLRGDQHA